MQFLKIILWFVIILLIVSFTLINIHTDVTVKVLPDDAGFVMRLPTLLFGTFLLGLVPYFLLHHATRWSLRRKLKKANRELETAKIAAIPIPIVEPESK